MPDRLSMHAPVLVNTLGHCAGAIVFGILLHYLLRDWRRDPSARSPLPCIAAGLALLWNLGSLIGLATASGNPISDAIVATSFSVLSVLPAVLLRISLGSARPALSICGYVVSASAVALHFADLITDAARFHYAAILLVTIGFGTLAAIELGHEIWNHQEKGSGKRLVASMVLFLLAVSFAHFRSDHDAGGWSGEAALHHAAIPLALFVLLQDYRFVLADAFIRFLTSAVLAAFTVWTAWAVQTRLALEPPSATKPFYTGLLFAGSCMWISLFAFTRGALQSAITRVVFLRHSSEEAIASLRDADWSGTSSEPAMLEKAQEAIQEIFSAKRGSISSQNLARVARLTHATPVTDPARYGCALWVQAIAPLRFSRGDAHFLLLGARAGGRRYLSEDIELLDRLAAVACERIERARNTEMQSLVSQAELRALQAQINPHFFFNALNTLYGAIPRESATARRLVLNLADLFRMSFASDRTSIRIEEELKIVRAYLEIEQLRLGDKLRSEIDVDDLALSTEVPILSIQPLVENAVKHGAASHASGGFVRLRIRAEGKSIAIEIANTGCYQPALEKTRGNGVGLANVRQRLALRFGSMGALAIESDRETTTVRFAVPAKLAAQTATLNSVHPRNNG